MYQQGLQEISQYAPNIHEILRVSSFDKNASLSGHLTPLIFRKKLMAETAEISELRG